MRRVKQSAVPKARIAQARRRLNVSDYVGKWVVYHPNTLKVLGHGPTADAALAMAGTTKAFEPVLYYVSKSDAFFVGRAGLSFPSCTLNAAALGGYCPWFRFAFTGHAGRFMLLLSSTREPSIASSACSLLIDWDWTRTEQRPLRSLVSEDKRVVDICWNYSTNSVHIAGTGRQFFRRPSALT